MKWPWNKKPSPEKPKEEEGELETTSPPQGLTPDGEFLIEISTHLKVPMEPMETFSERVIAQYDFRQAAMRETIGRTLFIPNPNGSLTTYTHEKGTKGQ